MLGNYLVQLVKLANFNYNQYKTRNKFDYGIEIEIGFKSYQVLKSKLEFPLILYYLGKIGMELRVKW